MATIELPNYHRYRIPDKLAEGGVGYPDMPAFTHSADDWPVVAANEKEDAAPKLPADRRRLLANLVASRATQRRYKRGN